MTDLTKMTLAGALDGMAKGEFSSVDLTEAHITACEAAAGLNAFITPTFDLARAQAAASDMRRKSGDVGLLEGAPLGMKDLFCTEGVKTTAASKILGDFTPPYESTVSANMKADGMVMLGKLNLDQFAMGSANET
jgi:aspartyl-tRNA(Asn)/glutamyl-tRNA(Gln) amidotransferase subunit A